MTKNRRQSIPAKKLQTILPIRWKFQSVPAIAHARRNAVDSTHAQLLAEESAAYALVANTISFPVLMPGLSFAKVGGVRPALKIMFPRRFQCDEGNKSEDRRPNC